MLRSMILVGQLGRVWSKSKKRQRIFQSMSIVGYFALMNREQLQSKQIFTIGKMVAVVERQEVKKEKKPFYYFNKKRPW